MFFVNSKEICRLAKNRVQNCPNGVNSNLRLLLGEAPAAAGDEGTPRKLCSHLLISKLK